MRRSEAKRLAETISDEQLTAMFRNAKEHITDWTRPSKINKTMSVGCAWNILLACGINKQSTLVKTNMIMTFGEFLPGSTKPSRRRKQTVKAVHQEPNLELCP